jgi:hypothetical protein
MRLSEKQRHNCGSWLHNHSMAPSQAKYECKVATQAKWKVARAVSYEFISGTNPVRCLLISHWARTNFCAILAKASICHSRADEIIFQAGRAPTQNRQPQCDESN